MFAIISPTRVEVDGNDAGLLYDYIIANPGKAAQIKAALVAWHASHVVADQSREQAKLDAIAAKEAALAAALSAKDADIAAKEAAHAAKESALLADLEALGTKEEAQAIRAAKEAADRAAKVAALRAELATLVEADPEPTTSTPESEKP